MIVDEHDQVRLGGYPGAFGDLLGVRIEEFFPLLAGRVGPPGRRRAAARSGPSGAARPAPRCSPRTPTGRWRACPALTRNGRAWYVGTRLADADLAALLRTVCAQAGVAGAGAGPAARAGGGASGRTRRGRLPVPAQPLRGGRIGSTVRNGPAHRAAHESARVPAGGVVVLHEAV